MSKPNVLSHYREHGYAVLKAAIEPGVIVAVRDEIQSIFRPLLAHYQIDGGGAVGPAFDVALGELYRRDMDGYLAAAKATQLCPRLHNLGSGELMVDLVKSFDIERPIIAVRPVVHIVSDAFQVPGGYHRTPPHQDWRSVQGSLDALVVWLPLVEVSQQFGALEVLPGSHRRGLLKTRPDPFGNVVDESQLEEDQFIPVAVEPGDAVVFSMFTVHRTGKEQRPGIRWAVSLRYNNAVASDFVEHRYPNPFVYRSQDALLVDGYPTLQDIHQVFDSE